MFARLLDTLLAWRRRRALVVVLAALGASLVCLVALPLHPAPLPWWAWLAPLAVCTAAYGALEPALAVLFAAGAGQPWARALPADPAAQVAGLAAGLALAYLLIGSRLARFRGLPNRTADTAAGVLLLGVVVAAAVWGGCENRAALLASPVAALALAPLCADALFDGDTRSGAPRLKHLLGGIFGFGWVVSLEFFLIGIAAPLLALVPGDSLERLRRLGSFGMARLFRAFPYGRVRFVDCDSDAFERPAIIVSNHQSAVDIPLILGLSANLRLTPRRSTVLRFAARKLGHVFVEPDRGEEALAQARALIEEGVCIHFFPEGTRARDIHPARFHRGAFELAVQLGCDIVPVVLCDSRMILPRGSFWVDDFSASVRVLPRITAGDFDHGRGSRDLMKHVQGALREAFIEDLDRVNTNAVLRRKVARAYRYQGWRVERAVRRRLRDDPLYPELAGCLPADGRVLDLGCGPGLAAHWLAESRPRLRVTGHDGDVRIARRSAVGRPRLRFSEGGAPYEPADAALVRTLSCLDAAALAEALAPGGYAVVPARVEEIGPALERAGFAAEPGASPARYRLVP